MPTVVAACSTRACADDPAMLMFTSGTTGRPKGAILSHGNALASAEGVRVAWRWTPDDRLVLTLPLFHMHGLGVGVHGTLLTGASMAIAPFSVDGVLDLAAAGASDALLRSADHVRAPRGQRPRRRARGAAAVRVGIGSVGRRRVARPRRTRRAARHRALRHDRDVHEHVEHLTTPTGGRAPSGIALPGVEVRLGDNDEICVRGPNVMRSYWERPDATADAFRDGWFLTGDIGEFDADGYLSIVGKVEGPHHHRRVQRLSRGRSRSCWPSTPESQRRRSPVSRRPSGARPSSPTSCCRTARSARPSCSSGARRGSPSTSGRATCGSSMPSPATRSGRS